MPRRLQANRGRGSSAGNRCEAATEKEILTGFGKLKYRRRLFRNYLAVAADASGWGWSTASSRRWRRGGCFSCTMPVRESVETAAALGPKPSAEAGGPLRQGIALRESEAWCSWSRIEEKQGNGGTEAQWREAANGVVCLQDGKGRCLKTSYFSCPRR